MSDLLSELHDLAVAHDMLGKGALGLALIVTDRAQGGLPIDPASMLAKGGAQIAGLSGPRVQAILERHGITRRLTSEGGRTSRGGPAKMRAYVEWLNSRRDSPGFDLDAIEAYWIDRVLAFFAGKPFTLTIDPAAGVRGAIRSLLVQVEARQREMRGATIVGTVVQHLIGAKLEVALSLEEGAVARHGASVSDQGGRAGDLELGDTAVHVTTAPGAPLIEKCAANLKAGKRPLIVTGRARLRTADDLLEDAGLAERVDVVDYEGFLAANVFEMSRFEAAARRDAFARIVERYNAIVRRVERDPSLEIDLR